MWRMVKGLFTLPALIVAGGVVFDHAELTPWALLNCALYPG
jgi:hypothetical protein